jgi:hypothetical protein
MSARRPRSTIPGQVLDLIKQVLQTRLRGIDGVSQIDNQVSVPRLD